MERVINPDCLKVMQEVGKAVKGKDDVIKRVMQAFLAGGHVLMEDIPGVGKTTMAIAFAKAMNIRSNRMQFTIDVLPSDVVGFSMYNSANAGLEYMEGAVMCNLFLADEINRTSSKTQAALLEAMEEGQVSVDRSTHKLPEPFMVIATENPVGSAGTQLLPESQLDRFMIRLTMGYPSIEDETMILANRQGKSRVEMVEPVITGDKLRQMQKEVSEVFVDDVIYEYIVRLSDATRKDPNAELGLSPRASLAVAAMARANAFLAGRTYVIPEDVIEVFPYVATHRIVLSSKSKLTGVSVDEVVLGALSSIPVPKKK